MSYVYRINCRIKDEGLKRALTYITSVCCFTVKNMFKDSYIDLRYSGRLLHGNKKTPYKDLGANDTYHTGYLALSLIFKQITISPEDVLIDVGCGKGRVINYWLSQKLKNRMIGLELDPEIATQTKNQFKKYNNVSIVYGDAIENLPREGTIFYFYNPFSIEKVMEFESIVSELSKSRPITIIYYNPKSIKIFKKEPWKVKSINFENDLNIMRWGRINKFHDLAIITSILKDSPTH